MRVVDEIIESVRARCPSVEVEPLQVAHPGADDDGIWYFDLPGNEDSIQIESWNGMCPFIIESDRTGVALRGETQAEVVNLICAHLIGVKSSS